MTQRIKYIVLLLPFTLLLAFLPACQSTYIGRWIAWNLSDIEDYKKFPKEEMKNALPYYEYPKVDKQRQLHHISFLKNDEEVRVTLDDLLKQSNTTAFIVIKNDSIYFEGYANGYKRESINTSFSIAKSITSLLIGIAIDQRLISSRHDAITQYLPELLESDPALKVVTFDHLLMMQSGFHYIDNDLPWGDKPKNYYGPHLRKRALNVKLDKAPGKEWEYMGYNPILCGLILEEVTGKTVPQYMEEQVWSRMGMEFTGSWSLDSDESKMAKMESGVNARAIDFAKIGSLYLHEGKWNGHQIISSNWTKSSTSLDGSVRVWGGVHYKDFWWIYPEQDELPQSYAATGHLGQYIFISPRENTVIVRFGKDKGHVDSWIYLFRRLSFELNNQEGHIHRTL